ncbi:DNA internalization-related competence protein ComEC/Rec2 [Dehalococcoidia bacterium]|nr:DNA internalization-related competence protein ComEC/Rec2 [Dehalococcoidia bacterium]
MRLVYLSLAWVLGIYLGLRFAFPWSIVLILSGVSLFLIILSHRKKTLLWGGFCLILLLGAILRSQSVPIGDELESYRGLHELRGVVVADPDVRDFATILRLEVREIKLDGEWESVSGTARLNAPRFPGWETSRDFPFYRYGDLLEMKGNLESPRPPDEEGEFDFREYLARQGIHSIISRPREITLVAAGQGSKPVELIYRLRGSMSQALVQALPEPQCSLARAMLLGQRGSLSPEIRQHFSRTGTAHLLAISGVHVSIVAGIALSAGVWAFGRRRPTYLLLALMVVWLYAMLSGMRPSAIRAATMGSLWLYADWIGRPRSAFTALTFAAAIMLAASPLLLRDIGFQLSFAAMGGLVFLTPIFQDWGKKTFGNQEGEVSSIAGFVIGSCAVSLGAIFATLPLIAYYFGLISLVGLPATFLTLPAIPVIILTSALVGMVGIFAPAVAGILGWVSWLFATYVVEVVELFAAIPFAAVDIEIGAPGVAVYYGILMATVWLPGNWKRLIGNISKVASSAMPELVRNIPLRWIIPPLAVVATLIWIAALTVPDDRLHIFILDVGQGDSILIQRGNRQILIDGGPSAGELIYHLGDKLPFWDRTIELLVLTHPDTDHITGLVEVLQRYRVGKILTGGQKSDSDIYREWRRLIEERGVERIIAQVGQQITMGQGVQLEVLHPSDTRWEERNNASVVLRLTYGNFSLLLTGDIETEAEAYLLARDVKLRSTVLKVAHQGSIASTSPRFLAEVKPMFAAISVGADNPFGHPGDEVIERLQEVVGEERLYLTSEDGTIAFITDGVKLWVKTND